MSGDDPEKLLSEALRAQATRAPADTAPVGFGLLSGSDLPPALRPPEEAAEVAEPPRPVPVGLVLLLALVLGLAAGAVVGLLTLI